MELTDFSIFWNFPLGTFEDYATTGKLTANGEEININVTKKGKQTQQTYRRENTQIIWVGKTGRLKEMYWWIRIKNPEKECYVTISAKRKFSFNLNKIFRHEASGLYNKLKELGYRVVLDMPSLWIQKLVGWLCTLAMFGITAYVFLVDELTGKNGLVLSKNVQFLFGCIILLIPKLSDS